MLSPLDELPVFKIFFFNTSVQFVLERIKWQLVLSVMNILSLFCAFLLVFHITGVHSVLCVTKYSQVAFFFQVGYIYP